MRRSPRPAVVDEPNDTIEAASSFGGGGTFSRFLCRNDRDVLFFDADAGRRYTATVDLGGSGQPGIMVRLVDEDGDALDEIVFGDNTAAVQVAAEPVASGTLFVTIDGTSSLSQSWLYTVTIAEGDPTPPVDCSAVGQPEEPNDSLVNATPIVLGEANTFTRCDSGDVDVYVVSMPPLTSLQVTLDSFFNAEGNLNMEMHRSIDASDVVDVADSVNDIEIVNGGEAAQFWIRVVRGASEVDGIDQSYRLRTVGVPRPAECSHDPTEDDDSADNAALLVLEGALARGCATTTSCIARSGSSWWRACRWWRRMSPRRCVRTSTARRQSTTTSSSRCLWRSTMSPRPSTRGTSKRCAIGCKATRARSPRRC